MRLKKWEMPLLLPIFLFAGALACRTTDVLVAQAPTVTPTRTPRPTITPIPTDTRTPVPTPTTPPTPTSTATRRPPTPRPPTPKPPPTSPPQPAQPTVSSMEFHFNPPTCSHAGNTYISGTVYLNRSDPNSKYVGAILALGAPDGSTVYTDFVKTNDYGGYTFTLTESGSRAGNWGIWMVTPGGQRKSDIATVTTNDLGDVPGSCWAAVIDFWK